MCSQHIANWKKSHNLQTALPHTWHTAA